MNTTLSKSILYLAAIVLFFSVAYLLSGSPFLVRGADATQIPATVATSSNPTVGTTAVTLFATSTCAARVITTYANPIMLTFGDYANQTPTATYGHLQSASTTVTYDAGQYGCGLFKVYGYTANTAITVTESR